MKKVTAKDVAELAEVSPATVSMILNNKENVSFSSDTVERVTQAARQLRYTVPSLTKSADRRRKKLLALFMTTTNNPYYLMLNQVIEHTLLPRGYHLVIYNIHRRSDIEKYYLDLIAEENLVEGIVYTFQPNFPQLLERLSASIPAVIIGEKDDSLNIDTVGLNKYQAGVLITEHLVQLGHQRIAFITPPMDNLTMMLFRKRRYQGILDTLKRHRLDEHFVLKVASDENDNATSIYELRIGYELTRELLRETRVSAIIGMNDMVACGIMQALNEEGWQVPQQISVCGFDNIFVSSILTPTLTTIDHCLQHRVKTATDLLIEKIEHMHAPEDSPHLQESAGVYKIEYEPQLIVRRSTGPCVES